MRSRLHLPYPVLFLVFLTLRPPALSSLFNRWHGWDFCDYSIFANAKPVNVTVDDSSPEIVYSPANSWHSSANPCSTCLAPSENLAFQGTWHDGTHIIPTVDADDLNTTTQDDQNNSKPSRTASPSTSTQETGHDDDDSDDDDDDDHKNDGGGGKDKDKGKGKRELRWSRWSRKRGRRFRRQDANSNPFFIPKLDDDDEGFVDTPVFTQFNFTGSAVYVFALIPLFPAAANSTPTFVNLTYTLDSQSAGSFSHSGTQNPASPTPTPSAFAQSVPVFARSGLPEGSHSLTINVGPDSVLLLDYIIYSQDDGFDNGNGTDNAVSTTWSAPGSSGTGASAPSGAATQSTDTKQHNIATFAGAVGGSVGLLAVLALSLALSIYRRRRAARRRDRRYRAARTRSSNASISESFHTDASEDGPPMSGPSPFVPRYFPGTVPAAPPPYVPSHSPGPTDALLAPSSTIHSPPASVSWNTHRPGSASESGDTSYADRPPPTPPLIEDGYYAPPPTFGEALASPIPAILARLSGLQIPSQATSPRPASQASMSTPPSRQPSRSSMVARSSNETTSDRGLASLPAYTRGLSSQGSNSSLRGGLSSLPSGAAQPLLTQTPPQIHTSLSEVGVDRPSTSHSQRPPSIPPPIEGSQTEQDARRTADDDLTSR